MSRGCQDRLRSRRWRCLRRGLSVETIEQLPGERLMIEEVDDKEMGLDAHDILKGTINQRHGRRIKSLVDQRFLQREQEARIAVGHKDQWPGPHRLFHWV